MSFSRISSTLRLINRNHIIRPIIFNRTIFFSKPLNNVTPSEDKDYYALKVTIDDIRAKYGLRSIKDANLEQNSDLTFADIKQLTKIQELLEKTSQDLSYLMSTKSEIFKEINDNDMTIKTNVKKSVWLAEDDDVSGNAQSTIKAYKESRVVGDANAYDLDDGKNERDPVGFRQDLYS